MPVRTVKVLFLAAAALEHHEQGIIFSDPYDGLWSFIAEQFKARGLRRQELRRDDALELQVTGCRFRCPARG